MQYLLIFLAVLIVIVCMNGFMFLAIRQTTRHIREQVEGRFIRELSVFDELYEEKAERLEQLKADQARSDSNIFPQAPVKTKAEALVSVSGGGAADIPVSRTSNPDFMAEYRYVKAAFDMDFEAVIRQVAAAGGEPEWQFGELADRFLAEVPAEVAFRMSTLDGGEQLEILDEVLEPEVGALLERYMTAEGISRERFRILEFLSYAKNLSQLYRDEVTVYTGNCVYRPSRPDIRVVYDPSICEGMRIARGNRLYDYSF